METVTPAKENNSEGSANIRGLDILHVFMREKRKEQLTPEKSVVS